MRLSTKIPSPAQQARLRTQLKREIEELKRHKQKQKRRQNSSSTASQPNSYSKRLNSFSNPASKDWREEPLSLNDFVRSPLHMSAQGAIALWDKQQYDLDQFLGTDPKLIFDADHKPEFQQAFICFGKGSGKDYMVALLQCWIAHILLCLNNPQQYFGLAPGEAIDTINVAYNLSQSKHVYFAKFKIKVRNWPWLRETIDLFFDKGICDRPGSKWLKDKEHGGHVGADHVVLPWNINCWSLPASQDSLEGKNTLFWVCDELSAFTSEAGVNLAKNIHLGLKSSGRTRFGDRWRGVAISWPRSQGDYFMKTIEKALKGLSPRIYAITRPTWEVNPNVTFESLADDFEANPEDSWAKYGCRPPAQQDPYFRDFSLLAYHATGAPIELLRRYLLLPEEELLQISQAGENPIIEIDKHGDPVLDRRGFPRLARWFRGDSNPLTGSKYRYFIHLDPGVTGDAFGFAMGHNHVTDQGCYPVIDLAFRWTGQMFKNFGEIIRPSWFSDTVQQTQNISAREVDFRTVREFIYFLFQARNFDVEISTDRWNSVDSKQELRQRGFIVSDRLVSKEDYDHYKSLVYTRILRYYGWPILIDESAKLRIIGGTKVEAPRTTQGDSDVPDSHKDVSDAVAAVCRRLVITKGQSVEYLKIPLVFTPQEVFENTSFKEMTFGAKETLDKTQLEIVQRFLDSDDNFHLRRF